MNESIIKRIARLIVAREINYTEQHYCMCQYSDGYNICIYCNNKCHHGTNNKPKVIEAII